MIFQKIKFSFKTLRSKDGSGAANNRQHKCIMSLSTKAIWLQEGVSVILLFQFDYKLTWTFNYPFGKF